MTYSYVRRWKCRACGSEELSVAIMWADSVEEIDQDEDRLGPVGCGPGDVAHVLSGHCNTCCEEGDPREIFERRRVRV